VPSDSDFADFYTASYGRVLALATAVLGDRAEAEDVAQEAFARALLRWPVLRRYDSPEAWVRRVALRLTVDARRRAARVRRAIRTAPAGGVAVARDVAGDLSVNQALLALPFRQREVIFLHYHADLTVAQIARELRLPESTVKARLAGGRRRLEHELSDEPEAAR